MEIILLSYKVSVVLLMVARLHTAQTACSVTMNGGLPDHQPLILTPDGSRDIFGFKLPSPDGTLSFAPGEEVRLVCAGSTNFFQNLESNQKDIRVRCDSGTTFTHDGDSRNFDFFSCSEVPRSTTRRSGTRCNNKRARIIEIGFQVTANEFFKIVDVCFDERKMNSVWSKIDLVSTIVGGGESDLDTGGGGSTFTPGSFYPGLDPEDLYTEPKQRFTIGRIIGNLQADHFINSTYYLTKGLLSDGANFVYTSQKLATMYFINSAPQWQTFRRGAWGIVEKRVRDYAHTRGVNLVVYTGTHGITTLPDVSKMPNERELYLAITNGTKQIAVPAIFWKVVYEPLSKKGVVMVGVNNPHKNRSVLEVDNARYRVCARKRYISSWHICASVNQQAGFGYCCTVDDFRSFVTSLPAFEVTDLLT